ncbi:MAG: aspartyl protease family protein [Planctomycetia bacterium]|nr:aspartyl protease family protein [Planctomycetia bacterium]
MFSRAVAALWACALGSAVEAAPYVTLGPSDVIALDQPRVAVEVVDPATQKSFGPEFANTFLLDTGATGVVVGANAYAELADSGYQTVAQYDEQGVAGTETMDVSKAYDFRYAGSDGIPILRSNTRLMSNPNADLGFDGIVGMPAMVGRTTTVDMTVWSGGNFDLLTTDFTNSAPPVVSHQYHVPLTLVDFPASGQQHPGDPLPTFAPLPTLPVIARNAGRYTGAQFVLDTGAQLSMISSATATKLGINPATDAVDSIEVGGIGGTISVPLVLLPSIEVVTSEGINLEWTDLEVGVLDIDPSIAGIFGMDFLTSGWFDAVFGGPDGFINKVYFDFRNAANKAGTMVLDIKASLDQVVRPGDVNNDGRVDISDINFVALHWLQSGSLGDANRDGRVNISDIQEIALEWLPGGAGAAATVPEPSGWILALAAAALLPRRRRRR